MSAFISKAEIETQRQEQREARGRALATAQAQAEYRQQKEQEERKHQNWSAPGMADRIAALAEPGSVNAKRAHDNAKSSSDSSSDDDEVPSDSKDATRNTEPKKKRRKERKEKKAGKEKKSKHHKKHHKKERHDDELQPAAAEGEWVEAEPVTVKAVPAVARDNWMLAPTVRVPVAPPRTAREPTNTTAHGADITDSNEKKVDPNNLAGRHARELNPYWKENGMGVPTALITSQVTGIEPQVGSQPAKSASWRDRLQTGSGRSSGASSPVTTQNQTKTDASFGGFRDRYVSEAKLQMRAPSTAPSIQSSWSVASSPKDIPDESGTPLPENIRNAFRLNSSVSLEEAQHVEISSNTPVPVEVVMPVVEHVEPSPAFVAPLSKDDINKLAAKKLRAEIMGNQKLAADIQKQIDDAEYAAHHHSQSVPPTMPSHKHQQTSSISGAPVAIVNTITDRVGRIRPLPEVDPVSASQIGSAAPKKRAKPIGTHDAEGVRERYYADDDQLSLAELVRREKAGDGMDMESDLARTLAKAARRGGMNSDDFMVDDAFETRVRNDKSAADGVRQREAALRQQVKSDKAREECRLCFASAHCSRQFVVAVGITCYLAVAANPLTPGHCIIVPMDHTPSRAACDEGVYDEVKVFIRLLTKMFKDNQQDLVIIETVTRLHKEPHTFIECIPIDLDAGATAPMYFKNAILEAGSEWAQHKKLMTFNAERDLRRSVPPGFSYFSVEFGTDFGYATIIEDEEQFSRVFGKEIVGGMLGLLPYMWKKPPVENFETQTKPRILEFCQMWKPYDWTVRLQEHRGK